MQSLTRSLLLALITGCILTFDLTVAAKPVISELSLARDVIPSPVRSSWKFGHQRSSVTARHVDPSKQPPFLTPPNNNHPIAYGWNWCGAQGHLNKSDQASIRGTFAVPDLVPDFIGTSSGPRYMSTFIGIDGDACKSGFLQAGVTSQINHDETQTHQAFWQWWPDPANYIPTLKVSPGDWLSVEIVILEMGETSINMTNTNTGDNYNAYASGSSILCRTDVEWMVEAPMGVGTQTLKKLATFPPVEWTDCSATTYNRDNPDVNMDTVSHTYLEGVTGNIQCMVQQPGVSNTALRIMRTGNE